MKRSGFVLAALAASALFAVTPALAQAKLRAGTLTCSGGAGIGLVLGSQKSYSCKYVSASGQHSETYTASVNKIGLDIGVTDKSTIIWAVLASTSDLDRRALQGNYVGATADAAIGIGGGANVLVGGSGNSVVLQPLSVQGQTGLNLAVGVAELTIR